MKMKFHLGMVSAVVLGLAALGGSASATLKPIDPSKVQILVGQLETALAGLGSSATSDQAIAMIQSIIASSGDTASEAEAALEVVQAWHDISPAAAIAVAYVDKTIELALAGGSHSAGPGGGPGGGAPIGGPAAYVSGGGSNYLTP
jgi:hypothetical protein